MREVTAAARSPNGVWAPMTRLMVIGTIAAAAACSAISAHAQDRHGPGGPGGPAMMMFGGPPEHVSRAVDHLLDGLSASDAQRMQVKQIAMAAAADLKTQRDAGRSLRQKAMQIFAAPTVDANAAEAVRQQLSAQHEQGSKRMLQAMLDVAKVLTPDQRAKIGERMKERQAIMEDRMQRMQQERAARGPRSASQPAPQK